MSLPTVLIKLTLLQHSYGFIQCCDRQARLFFHFSQFDGNIEHLKIGDPVEFAMTYDRRTGKPIASLVSKIAPEVVMSEERVIGTVTTETRTDAETKSTVHGRISYENRGECFFLPFTQSDVEGNVVLASGDKVQWTMSVGGTGPSFDNSTLICISNVGASRLSLTLALLRRVN